MAEGNDKPETSKAFLYSIMVCMLLTGSANTLVQAY